MAHRKVNFMKNNHSLISKFLDAPKRPGVPISPIEINKERDKDNLMKDIEGDMKKFQLRNDFEDVTESSERDEAARDDSKDNVVNEKTENARDDSEHEDDVETSDDEAVTMIEIPRRESVPSPVVSPIVLHSPPLPDVPPMKKDLKGGKGNHYTEAEDFELYKFVFDQIRRGIPKSKLGLGRKETWEKIKKKSTIDRDGESMKTRWSQHLKYLDRILEIEDFPEDMAQVLKATFKKE